MKVVLRVCLLGILGVLGLVRASHAANPDRCQQDRACHELTEQAAQLAARTSYDEALALYQRAYELIAEPRLLVNIGRCHYRLGRARMALESYEAFQKAATDPEPELATRVSQFISEARSAIREDKARPGSSSAQGEPKTETPEPEPKPAPPPKAEPLAKDKPKAEGGTRAPRPVWRVAVGASVLGLGGVFIGLGAAALAADGQCVQASATQMDRCAVTTRADGTPTALLIDGKPTGIGLLVSGSVLAVGGIVLIALPGRRNQVALRPSNLSGDGWRALVR